jgi:hypothetical protein
MTRLTIERNLMNKTIADIEDKEQKMFHEIEKDLDRIIHELIYNERAKLFRVRFKLEKKYNV